MFEIGNGRFLIDSPGFSLFDAMDFGSRELAGFYPEMRLEGASCRFQDCSHTGEPGCFVEELLRDGTVSAGRYERYLKIYAELKELTPSLRFLYLDNCINRYKARRLDLVAMLGISNPGFGKMIAKLPGKLEFKGGLHKPAPEWLAFINGEAAEIIPEDVRALRDPVPAAAEPAVVEPIPDEPTVEVSPVVLDSPVLVTKPEINPYRVTLSLVGTPAQLADVIAVLTDKDTAYDFEVTISMKGGD